jgi:hypothetical protein
MHICDKRRSVSIVAMLLCVAFANAQDIRNSIRGVITDVNNEAIPGVAVLMHTIDSVYVGAAVTDSVGYFSIASSIRPYRLSLQHLLYEPTVIESHDDNLGHINLEENVQMLSEVTVTADYLWQRSLAAISPMTYSRYSETVSSIMPSPHQESAGHIKR